MTTPPAGYAVGFTTQAARDLKRLDPPVRRRVLAALDLLVGDVPRGDVRALSGRPGQFRLRVADWRVLYRLEANTGSFPSFACCPGAARIATS
ncbi:MAG: hypothetical protein JWO90_260 [Solirubrobacterales bacterium]|jgi:mRNA interferase RelE/StbE|nr:hypothetical protein [Solirubrobacterales bacterium]